jgi:hypothetical protein
MASLDAGSNPTRWIEAAVVSDLADMTATLIDKPVGGGRRAFAAGVAGSAALFGVWLRTKVETEPGA